MGKFREIFMEGNSSVPRQWYAHVWLLAVLTPAALQLPSWAKSAHELWKSLGGDSPGLEATVQKDGPQALTIDVEGMMAYASVLQNDYNSGDLTVKPQLVDEYKRALDAMDRMPVTPERTGYKRHALGNLVDLLPEGAERTTYEARLHSLPTPKQ